jgi:hypothetical protein
MSYINHRLNTKHIPFKICKMILALWGILGVADAEPHHFPVQVETEYNLTFDTVLNAFQTAFPPAQPGEHYVNQETTPLPSDFLFRGTSVSNLEPRNPNIGTLTIDNLIKVTLT